MEADVHHRLTNTRVAGRSRTESMHQRISVPKEVPVKIRSLSPLGAGARLGRGAVLALISVLAACGSGGGSTPRAVPSGSYHSVVFKGIHGSPDNVRTHVGTSLWNGIDTLTDVGSLQNENGVISTDPGGPVIPFTLSEEGVLSVRNSAGTEILRGGVIKSG